jgi:hypothetical protein
LWKIEAEFTLNQASEKRCYPVGVRWAELIVLKRAVCPAVMTVYVRRREELKEGKQTFDCGSREGI